LQVTVVFAQETRKAPDAMRVREGGAPQQGGGGGGGGGFGGRGGGGGGGYGEGYGVLVGGEGALLYLCETVIVKAEWNESLREQQRWALWLARKEKWKEITAC
jgi:hypothetical protein